MLTSHRCASPVSRVLGRLTRWNGVRSWIATSRVTFEIFPGRAVSGGSFKLLKNGVGKSREEWGQVLHCEPIEVGVPGGTPGLAHCAPFWWVVHSSCGLTRCFR